MTNVFLTGATGFVGSHLAPALNSKGYSIYALVRHSANPTPIPNYVKPLHGDLLDLHSLRGAIRIAQPEIVVHTAAFTPVRKSFTNPYVCGQVNYLGTINMVHATLESPMLRKFIYASTAECYKSYSDRQTEKNELFGSTAYGVSKVAAELYVRVAGDCHGLPYIVLRPSNSYGRKTEKGYLIEKIVTTMLTSNKLSLDGTPDPVRDFMYIDDHVCGYLAAIEKGKPNNIFNISTCSAISVAGVVTLAAKVLDWTGDVSYGSNVRPYDPPYLVLDNTKAAKQLNWQPKVPLNEGLRKVADYWKDKL